jgi:catalase
VPCRLAAIGAVVATLTALAGAFAYAGGWITPNRLTAQTIINQFQHNAGLHEGFRRNHAKGVCIDGYFESDGAAASLSSASVFAAGRTPVIGRLAIPGGNPAAPDGSSAVRSMALMFTQPDGQQWRSGMNSTPMFGVHTPEQFYQQLVAAQPDPATGKPDPVKQKAFLAANPESQALQAWMRGHPPASSYANTAYYSVNAFYLVDAHGRRQAVRWSMQPELPYTPVTAAEKGQPAWLADDLVHRLEAGPLRWHLRLTLAAPGDPTDDATLSWPDDRKQIDAGTLVIEHASAQDNGACRDVNFDPTILPAGIAPSGDPLLAARSAAYALSYQRRTREVALGAH